MARPKTAHPEELLTHNIIVRVTEDDYNKYDKLCENSDCTSVAEVVRRILSKRKIILFYKDNRMDIPMESITAIYKELKSIGNNINQVTRMFHHSKFESQQQFQVQKALEQYRQIDGHVQELLAIISELSKVWLQK